jgi:hypothetical protein
MPTISNLGRRLATPLLCLALAGCSASTDPVDTLPRKGVTGTVTLDGQPLAQGKIVFEPAPGSQGPGGPTTADITDGKYTIEKALGPVPGKYKVSISSRPSIKFGPGQEPGTRPKLDPEKVPAQYNTTSTLTADITDASVNTANFELTSK